MSRRASRSGRALARDFHFAGRLAARWRGRGQADRRLRSGPRGSVVTERRSAPPAARPNLPAAARARLGRRCLRGTNTDDTAEGRQRDIAGPLVGRTQRDCPPELPVPPPMAPPEELCLTPYLDAVLRSTGASRSAERWLGAKVQRNTAADERATRGTSRWLLLAARPERPEKADVVGRCGSMLPENGTSRTTCHGDGTRAKEGPNRDEVVARVAGGESRGVRLFVAKRSTTRAHTGPSASKRRHPARSSPAGRSASELDLGSSKVEVASL